MYRSHILIGGFLCACLSAGAQHSWETKHASFYTKPANATLHSDNTSSNSFLLPAHGSIREVGENHVIYEGSVKNHRLHGSWKSWFPNGKIMDEGFFRNGIPDGEWKHWDSTGQLLAVRHYSADKWERVKNEMRLSHPRNSFFAITDIYKKNTRQAESYLQSSYSFPRANKMLITNSLIKWVENSYSIYQPPFSQCLHHGLFMNFYGNGSTRDSGTYYNGLKNGLWSYYTPSGERWLGKYKDGIRQQEWKKYGAHGRLETIIYFDKVGKEQWKKDF